MAQKPKSKDLNKLGGAIINEATREDEPRKAPQKDPVAVARGRKGEPKGGKAIERYA